MKRLLKYLLSALATLLGLVIVLSLYLLFGDLSVHRDRILAAASDATGFDITSNGVFELEIGREISLTATQVVVANPGWPDAAPVTTAGELQAVVDTWSLVSGPVEVITVKGNDAAITLVEGADGSANWLVPVEKPSEVANEPATADPIVQQIVLNDIQILHKIEGASGTRVSVHALELDRRGPNQYDMHVDLAVDQVDSSSTIVTDGSLRLGDSLTNVTNVQVNFDSAEIEVTDAVAATFSGVAAIDVSTETPVVDAAIEVSSLLVRASTDAQANGDESDDGEFLFSTDPLAYSWLGALNLDADVQIAEATVDDNTMSDIHIAATIIDGALKLSPVELRAGDGSFSGSLELTPVDGQYTLKLNTDIDALRLAQLAGDDQDPASIPPLSAQLELAGQGASIHDILASSNGRFSGRHDDGQLKLKAINALFSDFLTSILRTLNPLAEEQTYTNLECGIYEIQIAEGIAEIEKMVFQSERLTIVSSGHINLGTETIDLVMRTKTREGLGLSVGGVSNSFVKLGGTLKEPSLNVDAAGTVTTAGAAVATGGLSVLAKSFWDRLSGEVDLCSIEQPEER